MMELPEVLRHLESPQRELVEEAKKNFHEQFNNIKENWLLNGLVDYYFSTGSQTCVEILVGVREPHDRYFFDKALDSLRNVPSVRFNMLNLLGEVVFRQPTWLYKISQHPLLKELIKVLKTETDIPALICALLTLIVLLTMIPAYVGPFLQEIFEVFSRLAAWNTHNPNKLPEDQLMHLQVSLHSLFNRLYGMYPCNFLMYLRHEYSTLENLGVFSHTIKPMVETVKMHPMLVTASKDSETSTKRWKSMEHHDVVVECAKLSVDSKDDCNSACITSFRPRSDTEHRRHVEMTSQLQSLIHHGPGLPAPLEISDLSMRCGLSTPPPPTPESSGPTSIPHTPITQSYVMSSSFPSQEGTSPPEAAIEATPETTPVKDSRHYLSRAPPVNSTVVRALNNLSGTKWSPTSTTPSQSQPSSPMKKEISPFRFPESHAEANNMIPLQERRKDSMTLQKINTIFQDRLNVSEKSKGSVQPSSPAISHDSSVVEQHMMGNNGYRFDDAAEGSQEDQEVLEISQLGEQLRIEGHSTTVGMLRHCDSVIQDYHPPLQDSELGDSPCNSGGLHMPNSRSMMDFKQKVHRWRYFSQCYPDSQYLSGLDAIPTSMSFQDSPIIPATVRRAHSCPEMKKDRPSFTVPDKADLDESLELEEDTVTEDKHVMSNGALTTAVALATTPEETKPATATCSTQTNLSEGRVYPYEYLFLGVFPPVEQSNQVAVSVSAPQRCSPTTTLDRYIEMAAGLAADERVDGQYKRNTFQGLETALKNANDQLVLLHLQLKFERQRREVHAERNRRLLGKSRNNRWLEEHNSALRDQLVLLEKDVDNLKNEMAKMKQESSESESKLQDRVKQLQEICESYEKQNKELKTKNEELVAELQQTKELVTTVLKDKQQVESRLFTVGHELKEAVAQASAGEQLRAQIDYLQKELIVMGETQQRYKEKINQLMPQNVKPSAAFQDNYLDEVRTLNHAVESRSSTVEALKCKVSELETLLSRKDMIIAEQKRSHKTLKEGCKEQLEAVEAKYKCQMTMTKKLEEHILELYNKQEASVKRNKRSVSSAQDVLSLAERGGMSSPLSLSLSSSEGMSMSSMVASESVPQRDLQSIVDEPEAQQVSDVEDLDHMLS